MLTQIDDHIQPGLKLLFVGYNPSLRSGETGHHYANPRNRFYAIIHEAGLTARRYRPEEDQDLLKIGYGFTNIVARPTLAAAEITSEEYAEGRVILKEKISHYKPKVVCFVGKGVYEAYSGRRNIQWGYQETSVVEGVFDFVAPSSSGLVRMKMDEIVDIFSRLHEHLD